LPGQSKAVQSRSGKAHNQHQQALTLLVGILEGEGGSGAILPGLGAQVVVEARSSSHGLSVEVGREGAILMQIVRQ